MTSTQGPDATVGDSVVGSAGPSPIEWPAAAVAWLVWLLAIGASILGLILGIESQATPVPALPQTAASFIAAMAIAVAYASVGLLLRLHRPGIVIGWLLLGIGLISGLCAILWNYVWLSLGIGSAAGPLDPIAVAMLNTLLVVPGWAILLFALILLFPNGHLIDRAWRPVLIGAMVIAVAFALALALDPGPLLFFPIYTSPYAPSGVAGQLASVFTVVTTIAVVIVGGVAAWSMIVRYRRSDPVGRRQLKWLAWGSSLAIFGGIVLLLVASRSFDPQTYAADLSWLIFAACAIALPVTALIAILREGLYDIDQLIGRTFVYGVLTAILAGVYAASIRLFNALFVGLTGQSNELALVLTTLILATTFTPIKKRLEEVADRRFRPPLVVAGVAGLAGVAGAAAVAAAEDGVPDLAPAPGPLVGSMSMDDLERRLEAIARRVAGEVLAESRLASNGAAQDQQPEHDEDERAQQVAQSGEAGPQS